MDKNLESIKFMIRLSRVNLVKTEDQSISLTAEIILIVDFQRQQAVMYINTVLLQRKSVWGHFCLETFVLSAI